MARVADYLAQTIADHGIRHVFLVTGGGAMFLNHAFGHHPALRCICNHHEQASAMAAEGYARVTGKPAVVNVTTGPGGINALNGVFGAWTDSVPMLIISGQVKRETCMASYRLPGLRQLGDQEADIIGMVRGITKYAASVDNPWTVRYHLERALHLATAGRPGPCWLDIPLDVQAARVEPEDLESYDPCEDAPRWDFDLLDRQCREVLDRIRQAERPVILVGTGVRLAGAVEEFHEVIGRLGIPVTTAWTAHDLVPSDHALDCGRPGSLGDRPGNFTVQNADLLLVIGSRLNIRQVSYNWKTFARRAFKIQVDIDAAELGKPTVRPDLPIHCDAGWFLRKIHTLLDEEPAEPGRHAGWLAWCRERRLRYPIHSSRNEPKPGTINPYRFIDALFEKLRPDDVVVCGNGSACVMAFQAAYLQKGQRLFCNSGSASMGYDLPAALGACIGRDGRRVICLAGDGSIQMNLQELQTVVHHRLPVKVFVLNNNGYLSIRQSQLNFFGKTTGESSMSGVSFPDVVKIARAYGIPALRVGPADLPLALAEVLEDPGPALAEILVDPDQPFEPKAGSKQLPDGKIVSPPLEDMAPFLDKDELRENLLIPEVTYS